MIKYADIKRVHLEISTRCNAACPDCPRNVRGADADLSYPLVDMRIEQVKQIFTQEFLLQLDRMLICGNLGDFITAKDGVEIVEYFRNSNPNLAITISTNASGRPDIWERLAQLKATVHFRLDGLEDTHHLYRRYTNYNLILNNAKKFITAGGEAVWSFIMFDHNKHQVDDCKILSEQLGFAAFEVIDQGRNTFPVFDRQGNFEYTIGDYKGSKVLNEVSIFDPSKPPDQLTAIDCYAKKKNEIYVAANGEVFPCCWLGFYPMQGFKHNNNLQLLPLVKENNALEYGIEHSIKWFASIENTWNQPSCLVGCLENCRT